MEFKACILFAAYDYGEYFYENEGFHNRSWLYDK